VILALCDMTSFLGLVVARSRETFAPPSRRSVSPSSSWAFSWA
jgi:hypothetical protein